MPLLPQEIRQQYRPPQQSLLIHGQLAHSRRRSPRREDRASPLPRRQREGRPAVSVQVPLCLVVINSHWKFIEHVGYRKHFGACEGLQHDGGGGGDEEDAPQSKRRRRNGGSNGLPWLFAFSEDAVRVPQWKGVFPFLRLPFGQ